jgi:glycosyltransferase involved in cell wall biosynthesis
MKKKHLILFLSILPWDFSLTYLQEHAEYLSTVEDVLYVTPYHTDTWGSVIQVFRSFGKGLRVWLPVKFLPLRLPFARRINLTLSAFVLRAVIRIKSRGKIIVTIATFPFDQKTIRTFPCDKLIYDCVDYPGDAANPTNDKRIKLHHKQLLRAADMTCVNSDAVGVLCAQAKKMMKIPTGYLTADIINSRPSKPLLSHIPRPVIGFLGFAFAKLDLPLLMRVAKLNPRMSFVLVGPALGATAYSNTPERAARLFDSRWKKLTSLPNVYHIDQVDRKNVRQVLYEFDVGIIPYDVKQKPVHYGNPIKAYEYFAAGKPVVATPLTVLSDLTEYVLLAGSAKEFSRQIRAALESRGKDRSKRRVLAANNDVKEKARKVLEIL